MHNGTYFHAALPTKYNINTCHRLLFSKKRINHLSTFRVSKHIQDPDYLFQLYFSVRNIFNVLIETKTTV